MDAAAGMGDPSWHHSPRTAPPERRGVIARWGKPAALRRPRYRRGSVLPVPCQPLHLGCGVLGSAVGLGLALDTLFLDRLAGLLRHRVSRRLVGHCLLPDRDPERLRARTLRHPQAWCACRTPRSGSAAGRSPEGDTEFPVAREPRARLWPRAQRAGGHHRGVRVRCPHRGGGHHTDPVCTDHSRPRDRRHGDRSRGRGNGAGSPASGSACSWCCSTGPAAWPGRTQREAPTGDPGGAAASTRARRQRPAPAELLDHAHLLARRGRPGARDVAREHRRPAEDRRGHGLTTQLAADRSFTCTKDPDTVIAEATGPRRRKTRTRSVAKHERPHGPLLAIPAFGADVRCLMKRRGVILIHGVESVLRTVEAGCRSQPRD